MMIMFLRGVCSSSQHGALTRSIWNIHAWTLQEYFTLKIIHFYTENWTLYLDLELPNHTELPEVILEMEDVTGMPAQQLMALCPGMSSIWKKLYLASTWQMMLVEDVAHSLLGIFLITGIASMYSEGNDSLGHLLAYVLMVSGDVHILAWTGMSGEFNSYLPAHITVFNGSVTSHLPQPILNTEMKEIVARSHPSSFDLEMALKLYDHLSELSVPCFTASQMKLPCIAYKLHPLSHFPTCSGYVYQADTIAFGMLKIITKDDLFQMNSLYLVHPWLDTLLEHEDQGDRIMEEDIEPLLPDSDNEEIHDDGGIYDDEAEYLLELESPSHPACPFGALLVALASRGGCMVDYNIVNNNQHYITVQIQIL
ncbi:hypothetical protein HD554DRAFT_2041709 [Boletus coccyginus]|nr:hypothetical protein HD554DRAFT_2041709 [Boletus coccyginus]